MASTQVAFHLPIQPALAPFSQPLSPKLHAVAQPMAEGQTADISLSAEAELELEVSLRGSLLVQQQRRILQLESELKRTWDEVARIRDRVKPPDAARRFWTPDEERLFAEGVARYGSKDVKNIAHHVGTRTPTQVRTHAQKLFLRQQKETSGIMAPASKRARQTLAIEPSPEKLEARPWRSRPPASAGTRPGRPSARPSLTPLSCAAASI